MAIRSIDNPSAAQAAVLEGMQRRSKERGFWTPELKKADPAALLLCDAHRVAFLRLPDIRQNTSLHAAAIVLGWRFLIYKKPIKLGDEPIAAAHAVLSESGHYRLSELNEGEFVKGTKAAFPYVPAAVQVTPGGSDRKPLEVLLLFVPSVYFAGLWARFQNEEDDVVTPIEPTSRDLHPFVRTSISTAKLLGILSEAAKKVPEDSTSAG
jgi:hypothetical protein